MEKAGFHNKGAKACTLIHIIYRDHLLFRNADASMCEPSIRECVGWVYKESPEAVWVLWDRAIEKVPHERTRIAESGLVILKSEILEMEKLE